jgi:hypothetical protein
MGGAVEPVDVQIAQVARRHGGHIQGRQLRALGLGPGAIRYRIKIGRLIPVYHGVYAVACKPRLRIDQAAGALLACGPKSLLGFGSAEAAWGLTTTWRVPHEVIVPTRRRSQPGLRLHVITTLAPADVTFQHGLRVTTLARTILDMAPRQSPKRRQRAINDARLERHMKLAALHDVVERNPRHPGARLIRPLIATAPGNPFRSPFEVDWVPFAGRYDLPDYEMNVPIGGMTVDVLFREHGLVIELDGWETHGTRYAFEADRLRDAELLAAAGLVTVRITRARLLHRPAKEAAMLHRILERRAAERAA